jgi:hypothetical protein
MLGLNFNAETLGDTICVNWPEEPRDYAPLAAPAKDFEKFSQECQNHDAIPSPINMRRPGSMHSNYRSNDSAGLDYWLDTSNYLDIPAELGQSQPCHMGKLTAAQL